MDRRLSPAEITALAVVGFCRIGLVVTIWRVSFVSCVSGRGASGRHSNADRLCRNHHSECDFCGLFSSVCFFLFRLVFGKWIGLDRRVLRFVSQ